MRGFKSITRQAGVSLVEVLVAVVVFAVGLLAIAALQGTLVRSGNDSKSRTVATSLAEQKMEEFKAFTKETDFDNISGGTETFVGNDPDSDGHGSVSGVDLVRTWTVTDYAYSQPNGNIGAATGSPDVKRVEVTVTWCDANSGPDCDPADDTTSPEAVTLVDALSKTTPTGSAKAVSQLSVGNPPSIPYAPGQAPEVISIDLGNGKKKESPEPIIETTRKNNESADSLEFNTITRFDAITFIPPPEGSDAETVRRQEFISVNCTCQEAGIPADAAKFGHTPVFWDGDKYIGGVQVSKPIGDSVLASSDISTLQFTEPLCNTCCTDHHDAPDGTTFDHDNNPDTDEIPVGKYDPFRQDGELTNGDHHHYYPDSQDNLQYADDSDNSDQYLEACRFVRVNGILKLTHDFHMQSLETLPGQSCADWNSSTNECQSSGTTNLSSSWVDNYRSFVTAFVQQYAEAAASIGSGYPASEPAPTAASTGENLLPTTDTVPQAGEGRELVSRAIYIDYMHQILLDRIKCRLGSLDADATAACDGGDPDVAGDGADASGEPILPLVPFAEVNVQQQANWSVADGNLVAVTSDPVDNGGYSRGVVTLNDEASSTTNAFASIEQGNAGLTDTHEIYPLDLDGSGTVDPDELVQDSLAYDSSNAGEVRPTVSGEVRNDPALTGNNQVHPSDLVLSDGFGNSCSVPNGQSLYSCELQTDGSGTLTITGYTKVKNNGTLIADNKVCITNGAQYFSGTVSGDGTASDTTVFTFDTLTVVTDRTGYDIRVLPQTGGSLTCAPGQVK